MRKMLFCMISAAFVLISCDKEKMDDAGNNDTPVGQYDPSCEQMPVKWSDNVAQGTDVGVTIEVTKIENENFKFELRPGAKVQSYRMDVYPLAVLYNYLLNDGMLGKTTWEINEKIRQYIFASGEDNSYTFSVKDNEGDLDSFLQKEIDWMATANSNASAVPVPDADYIIAVVACTDTEASESAQEELTLCRVHTTAEKLIGNPSCEIDVTTGYRKFVVEHIPNQDCKYMYFFGTNADQFDAYIDAFGDVMFRDFLRSTTSSPYLASATETLVYSYNFAEYATSELQCCTAVICLDENKTPAAMYQRKDFHLKKIPENAEGADATLTIPQETIAANYFIIEAEIEANCNTIFYTPFTKKDADMLINGPEVDRALVVADIYTGGYGCHNPNFLFDEDEEVPCGSKGYVSLPLYGDFIDGQTYRIAYICRNAFGTISDLKFSDEFTLDKRNMETPANCKVKDFTLKLSEPSRQKFKIEVEYDPATVSMVYISYFYEGNSPECAESTNWKDWVDFIFTPSYFGTGGLNPVNDNISVWYRTESGYDPFWLTGMNPGVEYTVFCCAEDFDGNVSEILMQKISTEQIIAGPDPTMELSLQPSSDVNEDWTVSYKIVKDVASFKYALVDSITDISTYIPGITVSDLDDLAASSFSYEKCRDGFYKYAIELGLSTISDTSQSWAGDQTTVAVCVAIGADENGDEVYSKPYILVCKDGVAKTLEEIFDIK